MSSESSLMSLSLSDRMILILFSAFGCIGLLILFYFIYFIIIVIVIVIIGIKSNKRVVLFLLIFMYKMVIK